VIDEVNRAKPSSAKGRYILSATVTTTMGPGIKIDAGGKVGDLPAAPRREAEEPAGEEAAEEPASA
jgi:hypothetical protein